MTAEQARAFDQLRGFAKPFQYRVVPDQEGFPIIPCRLGQIEWYGESGTRLAAHTTHRLLFRPLMALPEVVCRQRGDLEIRVHFPADRLAEVARLLGARRRRTGGKGASPEAMKKVREAGHRGTFRPQERTGATTP